MTEDELIKACLQNNQRAQKTLFDTHSPRLMGVCLRYANNRAEAQDMLQDGFIKIFQKLDSFTGGGAFGGWMHRLVVNTCLDHIRRNKKMGFTVEIENESADWSVSEDAISQLRTKELLSLIQQLPEGYRVVFNMFAIEGYGHKEIAEELDIAENTSKSQYRKAKLKLQEAIERLDKVAQ